jgi:hypothetical protein
MIFPRFALPMLVLLLSFNPALPQSATEVLEYYPLVKGNYQIYEGTTHNNIFEARKFFVSDDTVMPNGKRYRMAVTQPMIGEEIHYYERHDSATGNVYRYNDTMSNPAHEYLLDSLRATIGNEVPAYRYTSGLFFGTTTCSDEGDSIFSGVSLPIKRFTYSADGTKGYTLAKGIAGC